MRNGCLHLEGSSNARARAIASGFSVGVDGAMFVFGEPFDDEASLPDSGRSSLFSEDSLVGGDRRWKSRWDMTADDCNGPR